MLLSLAVVALVAIPGVTAPPAVTAVAIPPDGHRVAFGLPGEVRTFGTGGERTAVVKIPDGRVTALAYSPQSRWLAVAAGEPGQSGVVRVYNAEWFGEPRGATAAILDGHKDAVYALAWSPDGRLLATAGYDRVIHLWEIPGTWPFDPKKEIVPKRTLKDHSDTVYSLAFHPDGKLLASASADRAVKVWDAATGTRLYTLSDPTEWVYTLAWSPDKKHLAAGGVDKSIRVWAADKDGGKLVHSVFAHEQAVWRLAYAPDGKSLFSVGEDRVVKRWDAGKMAETKVFPAMPDAILDFALTPDGKRFAVARFDGVGNTFDIATGEPLANQMLPVPTAAPKPAKLAPAVVARGSSTITVTGDELEHTRLVTASDPGVRAHVTRLSKTELTVEVTVEARVSAGAVRLVFENEAGKAAPLTLGIDRQTAIPEVGVTDSARAAMPITPNATVAGVIDRAGDVDYFRFKADRGYQLGVQVVAPELGSKLDPVLVLTDAGGKVLLEGGAVLGHVIREPGEYAVGVRDREYRGGPDFTYRLHVGDVPVVTGVFPLGVQRGKATTVHVEGVNLGHDGINLGLSTARSVTVTAPADAKPGSRLPVPLEPHSLAEKPLGTATVMVDEFPSVVLNPVAGTDLRVPGTADGILLKPGGQTVRFAAKAGERLVVETTARRAGSPVDTAIEILDAAGKPVPRATLRCTAKTFVTFRDHDSVQGNIRLDAWNELAMDDYLFVGGELMRILALPGHPDADANFYTVGGQRVGFLGTTPVQHSQNSPMYKVELHPPGRTFPPNGMPVFTVFYRNDDGGPGYGKDSRLLFEAPADGVYQVRVADARGSAGPTHTFRVTVRPPKPDFTVSVTPNAPAVWKGGALPVTVTVNRTDGFDGPVRVKFDDLPPGFSAPEGVVEGNLTTTSLALFAAVDATVPADARLMLTATGTVGGQEVTRTATGGTPKLVDPGDIVTTTREPVITIKPGQETKFTVDIVRRNKFAGRVPIDVKGLPHGVRVQNIGLNGIMITERETSREVVLYAEPWVQPADHPIVVLARREGKNTEHAAKAVMLNVK